MKNAVFTTLLICLLLLCTGCQTLKSFGVKQPAASLEGLKLQDISLSSATLLFDMQVDNPYPAALPLLNMDYGVSTGGNPLFSGTTALDSAIPANGSKVIPVPVKITYTDLIQAFKNFRPGSSIPYTADINLFVNTPAFGQIRLPVTKQGQLQVPDLRSLQKMDINSLLNEITPR